MRPEFEHSYSVEFVLQRLLLDISFLNIDQILIDICYLLSLYLPKVSMELLKESLSQELPKL